jgi:hypothetical protein
LHILLSLLHCTMTAYLHGGWLKPAAGDKQSGCGSRIVSSFPWNHNCLHHYLKRESIAPGLAGKCNMTSATDLVC